MYLRLESSAVRLLLLGSLLVYMSWKAPSISPPNDHLLRTGYDELLQGDPSSAIFREALQRDPASPYRWLDLALALQDEGHRREAEYCVTRGVALGPGVPAILLRSMNMAWTLGDTKGAIAYSRTVLQLTPQYDSTVFAFYKRMGLTIRDVLDHPTQLGLHSAQAFFRSLLIDGHSSNWKDVWDWMLQRSFVDDGLAQSYLERLFAEKRVDEAASSWAQYASTLTPGYPEENAIFNGGFERNLSGTPFDWRIDPIANIRVTQVASNLHSGSKSIELDFGDNGTSDYQNLSQLIPVSRPGTYHFDAHVRTEAMDCEEGIRFRIFDPQAPGRLLLTTNQVTGSTGWIGITTKFSVTPTTHVLMLQVVRRPSSCTNAGRVAKVWIDDVSLQPR